MAVEYSYDTVTAASIWKALHSYADKGIARDYVDDLGQRVLRSAKRYTVKRVGIAGVGDPLDAMHRGGTTGTYLASWYPLRSGGRTWSQIEVGNFADHAEYVEFGHRSIRQWQRFSWSKAGIGTYDEATGKVTYDASRPGAIIATPKTRRRAGKYIMRDAARSIAKSRGVLLALDW